MKPIGSKRLATDRLVIRPLELADGKALVQTGSLKIPVQDVPQVMSKMIAEMHKPFAFHWVITLEHQVIGRIKAWDVNPYNGYLQLGYDVAPNMRGKGYMTEALQAVIRFLLTEAEVNHVFCSVRESNPASCRVCEKVGMQHEGTLRQHYARQDGGYDNVRLYGILRNELIKESTHVT